ncbi:uncharacterized protein BCR38DRAFT_205761 [Pseudomassariella vexata]|uniref:Myocyte-specific enhancer factor 2d n=1 Tax=Pseudomassariella vexata TaxID=1141098 RepID=A0A1Y2DXU4_9PEZI|nr:uncharacterized protein BCR38DRAFT_205761 [Pseudomassariella vexata]ORY64057.1 hypothetical protein BCR38DRAFT_205761 [Pseudomassariella vexata]
MSAKMDIPGYYYDPEKKRYFKVENSKTAPAASTWSTDKVKRRKLEDEEAAAALQRMKLNKDRIRRSQVLQEPLVGGFLAREFGSVEVDVRPSAFARELLEKGSMPLADSRWCSTGNVKHLCVTSEDTHSGLGVAFATLDELSLISAYIPRDNNGRVHRQLLANYSVPHSPQFAPYQELVVNQISDVKYHKPSGKVFVLSRQPDAAISFWDFNPVETDGPDGRLPSPRWLLGWSGTGHGVFMNHRLSGPSGTNNYQSNTVHPSPESATSLCIIGSNRGILHWPKERSITWLAPTVSQGRFNSSPKAFGDIFALDFKQGDSNILFSGGRPGKLFIGDTRSSFQEWQCLNHGYAISHIRSLDHHNVLVAGLNNTMVTYDTRMMKDDPPSSLYKPQTVRPVLRFHEYKNSAHINTGLDFNKESGLVAAAHDDGKVALYSVKTGHRLSSPDIAQIQSNRGPIQAIQFQTMPNDVNPTLFVGVHSNLNAYSFGVWGLKDDA